MQVRPVVPDSGISYIALVTRSRYSAVMYFCYVFLYHLRRKLVQIFDTPNLTQTNLAMKSKLRITALVVASLLALSSCETIELTHEGEKARVLSPDDVKNCQKNGAATVSIGEEYLGLVPKRASTIAHQLQRLARNSAIHMGGHSLPMSKVDRGQQDVCCLSVYPLIRQDFVSPDSLGALPYQSV